MKTDIFSEPTDPQPSQAEETIFNGLTKRRRTRRRYGRTRDLDRQSAPKLYAGKFKRG